MVLDGINSSGNVAIPPLLKALGCTFQVINQEIHGDFAHNPEPLDENLGDLKSEVVTQKADLGIAVDPDVDRLAFVDEKGNYCGEEYTLVMIADWVLSQTPGNTVSNLSSTMALREVTNGRGGSYSSAAVGEVNVVNEMKRTNAIIGGEGNGGIIYPALHSGRDAMVGIALMLSALAKNATTLSEYRSRFPNYVMTKSKVELSSAISPEDVLQKLSGEFDSGRLDLTDGVKIYFDNGWAHVRKSNTEPILRIYTEGHDEEEANKILDEVKERIGI